MSTPNDTGLQQAQAKCQELSALLAPQAMGSDLSVLVDKIVAWINSLDLGSYGRDGVHLILHLLMEVVIPKLVEIGPTSTDMILTMIVLPLLKKIDEDYFHPAS